MRLKDKVALITGASSGIGAGVAARFAAEGARVAVNYRPGSPKDCDAAQNAVAGFQTKSIAVEADVSKRDQVEAMVSRVVSELGRIDICINNAGIEIKRDFLDTTDEEWHRVLGVNTYGSFVTTQAAARAMVKQGAGGRLIFMSSVHEDIPFPGFTPYCVSKGGIRMLTRTAGVELGEHGIRMINVAPGAVSTPINASTEADPKKMKALHAAIPLGRMAQSDEIADVVVFLASGKAGYMTATTVVIDGGIMQGSVGL